jgi:beta-carotene hydroxylase
MKGESSARPRLPAEIYRPSPLGAFVFVAYSVTLFVMPAALCRLVAGLDLPLLFRALWLLPLLFLAQQGLHLLGWVGHEGMHLSLSHNRYVSAILGIFFSSMVISFMEMGFAIDHWNHHRYTNQSLDPDCRLFAPYQGFWRRLFLARFASNRHHHLVTLRMAAGKPLEQDYPFPFSTATVRGLAVFNLGCSILWLSAYMAIALYDPLAGLVSIALPHGLSLLYTGLRPYVEHAGTETEMFANARTRTAPFFTALYFFNNYHLEHHLYPSVPCYRLAMVHRWLEEGGYFAAHRVHIESGVLAAYAHARANSRYPAGSPSKDPPVDLWA